MRLPFDVWPVTERRYRLAADGPGQLGAMPVSAVTSSETSKNPPASTVTLASGPFIDPVFVAAA